MVQLYQKRNGDQRSDESTSHRRSSRLPRRIPVPACRKKYVDESMSDEIERLKEQKRQREQAEDENKKKEPIPTSAAS